MQKHYILSVNSDDKPGVVETISSCIQAYDGSWLESRLAHLAGKFAGVIHIHIADSNQEGLEEALHALEAQGIHILFEPIISPNAAQECDKAHFTTVGPDRTGIVKEIASAFVQQGLNVEELETNLSSMPYSGEPIFEAEGDLSLPAGFDLNELQSKLDTIANDLGLDFTIERC